MIRRGSRSDDAGYYERQVLACGSCDRRIERSVKTDGTLRELNASIAGSLFPRQASSPKGRAPARE